MSSSTNTLSHAELIVKGILGSQILAVPFSCSLSAIVVILAGRYISKTSKPSDESNSYFQYHTSRSQPARLLLARWGAALVAFICVAMTAMELTIVYQIAVVHSGDVDYMMRAPWTSSMVPLLTAVVSIATQTYFSDRCCHVVQSPRVFVPILVMLGAGSLFTGVAASISLFTIGFEHNSADITTSEALFWAYLCFTTLSSLVIMIPLILSYLRDTRRIRIERSRTANSTKGPTAMTSFLRLFFSTYMMVFIFDFMCLVTSILSATPNFDIALQSSEAFLVLQKLMVRFMALSYLYALLDGIPKSPNFETQAPQSQPALATAVKNSSSARPTLDAKFRAPPSGQDSFIVSKNRPFASDEDDDVEEIFAYAYPPTAATSPVRTSTKVANHTPVSAAFNNQVGNDYRGTETQEVSHAMMDVDLHSAAPYIHPEHTQILVGYTHDDSSIPPSVNHSKKPVAYLPRRRSPPPSTLALGSFPTLPIHAKTLSNPSSGPIINSGHPTKTSNVQNQGFKNSRRSSTLKYINTASTHESLLTFSTDHSRSDVRPTGVVPAQRAGKQGYQMTLGSDEEDGEMSSMATQVR